MDKDRFNEIDRKRKEKAKMEWQREENDRQKVRKEIVEPKIVEVTDEGADKIVNEQKKEKEDSNEEEDEDEKEKMKPNSGNGADLTNVVRCWAQNPSPHFC